MKKLMSLILGGALVISSIYLWSPSPDNLDISGTYRAVGERDSEQPLTIKISPMAGAMMTERKEVTNAIDHMGQLYDLSARTRASENRDIKKVYERLSRTVATASVLESSRSEMDAVLAEALSFDLMSMERSMKDNTLFIAHAKKAEENLGTLESLLGKARDIAERAAGTSTRYNGGDRASEILAQQYADIMKELSQTVSTNERFSTDEGRSPLAARIRRQLRLDEVRIGEGAYDGSSVRSSLSTPSMAVSLMYRLDGIMDVVADERVKNNDILKDMQITLSKLENQSESLRAFQRERQMLSSGQLDGSRLGVLERTRSAAVSQASRTEPIVLSMLGNPSAIFSDHSVEDVVFLKSSIADATDEQGSSFETMLFGVPEDANNDGAADIIDFLAIVRTYDEMSLPTEKIVVFSVERG